MSVPPKSIRSQIDDQVRREIDLDPDDKAALSATDENGTVRVAGAIDLGKGLAAGGHVEKTPGEKIGWFAGITKRWKRKS